MALPKLALLLGAAAAKRDVPTIGGSFCDSQVDTMYAADGSVAQLFEYTLCMRYEDAQWSASPRPRSSSSTPVCRSLGERSANRSRSSAILGHRTLMGEILQ